MNKLLTIILVNVQVIINLSAILWFPEHLKTTDSYGNTKLVTSMLEEHLVSMKLIMHRLHTCMSHRWKMLLVVAVFLTWRN